MKYEKIRLLNADIDNITMDSLIHSFTSGILLTLHVDMIVKLQRDREFYDILPEFNVITCDSQILYLASKLLGHSFKERVSGSDFFPLYYMHHKNNNAVTIFLCGGKPGIADIAKDKINLKVGRKIIVGTYSPPFDYDERSGEEEKIIDLINQSKATVLLVGLGGGRQEKFLVKHRHKFIHAKVFLPLGGTIDYEAEVLKRPPKWMTTCGLEWLYRLILEPKQRWHRYIVHQPPVIYYLLRQRLGLYRNPFAK
jgi:exopolysaccharide biosynthesis WecB/TagA/CpsF family protein